MDTILKDNQNNGCQELQIYPSIPRMDNTKVKAIIVEDDTYLRESLVEYLKLEGLEVSGVGSCLGLYQALSTTSFSVAVIDVALPDQSGYSLAKYLRKNTNIGIVMLTALSAPEDRVRGYESGADLYMVKPVDVRELAAAIKSLATRIMGLADGSLLTNLPKSWSLNRASWQLTSPDGASVLLTSKELCFLSCLAEVAGYPVDRDCLYAELGYRNNEYAKRAMDSMVRRLRRKIEEVANQEMPIKTIHAKGYCFSSSITIL